MTKKITLAKATIWIAAALITTLVLVYAFNQYKTEQKKVQTEQYLKWNESLTNVLDNRSKLLLTQQYLEILDAPLAHNLSFKIAELHANDANYDQAILTLETIVNATLKTTSLNKLAKLQKAHYLLRSGEHQKSIDYLNSINDMGSLDSLKNFLLAQALSHTDQTQKTKEYFNKVIQGLEENSQLSKQLQPFLYLLKIQQVQ